MRVQLGRGNGSCNLLEHIGGRLQLAEPGPSMGIYVSAA